MTWVTAQPVPYDRASGAVSVPVARRRRLDQVEGSEEPSGRPGGSGGARTPRARRPAGAQRPCGLGEHLGSRRGRRRRRRADLRKPVSGTKARLQPSQRDRPQHARPDPPGRRPRSRHRAGQRSPYTGDLGVVRVPVPHGTWRVDSSRSNREQPPRRCRDRRPRDHGPRRHRPPPVRSRVALRVGVDPGTDTHRRRAVAPRPDVPRRG